MLVRSLVFALSLASVAAPSSRASSQAGGPLQCPAVRVEPIAVPHLKAALTAHEPAIIVAIGSSSTRGWQSSDPAHSYPAVLQQTLMRLLPHAHIAVINRGVNGEDAPEEVARLDSDVIAIRPQVVIWQVGANGALRRADPGIFTKLVLAGTGRLLAAGADVILMDNQRAPRILAAPLHDVLDKQLAEIADKTDATLFDRGALMDDWARAGDPYQEFIAPDNLHHNDRGYHCMAEALATAITTGMGSQEPGALGPGSQSASAK